MLSLNYSNVLKLKYSLLDSEEVYRRHNEFILGIEYFNKSFWRETFAYCNYIYGFGILTFLDSRY